MSKKVPRGTGYRQMRFAPAMVQAILAGMKTQTRRVMKGTNSRIDRGTIKFYQLDFSSGRPDGQVPVSALRCRTVSPAGDRRSVVVLPRIVPGMMLWPRQGQSGRLARRANAPVFMRVASVRAVRLNDISEADALAEGVEVFSKLPRPLAAALGTRLESAYDFLIGQLDETQAGRWRAGPLHQEMAARGRTTARDCFALLWEYVNGAGSWAENPWVWAYEFSVVAPGLDVSAPSVSTDALPPPGRGGAA